VEVFANFARGTTDTYLQKHSSSRLGAGIRRSDAAPPDSRCTSTKQKKSGAQAGLFFVVEVPGIEPGSLGEDLVILRAQFALAFLCPDVHANKMSTGTVTVRFSVRTRDRFRW